jgi:hypothetical protein
LRRRETYVALVSSYGAGARPDAKLPEDDSKADFSDGCAIEEVVRAKQLEVLKKMQPEKYPDRLPELLEWWLFRFGSQNA